MNAIRQLAMHLIRTMCTVAKYTYQFLNIQFTDLELPNSETVLTNMT